MAPGSVTFGDVWRRVRLAAPGAPFGLCRQWTQQAYTTVAERRPWNWSRVCSQLEVPAATTVVAVFTFNSLTVTAAPGTFTPAMVGQQLRVARIPIYTINAVDGTGATATLDQVYTDPVVVGSQTATVAGIYQTLPADFGAFLLVIDPYNQRLIPWWFTQEDLARLDPGRMSSDATPRVLVSRMLSTVPATLGQVQYEWWPSPTAQKAFPFYYRQRPPTLGDDDPLLGVLAQHADILETGALMRCARWPGTTAQKNPYFNMGTYKALKDEFEVEMAKLELRDDDTNQDSWTTLPYHRWATWDLTFDTRYLRSSDASVGDYRVG